MPQVIFTPNLHRHVGPASYERPGTTVREVLDGVFEVNPQARGYVLDDQQALRKHIAVFINGMQVRDRNCLSDRVSEADVIYVMQALSGG